MSAAGPPASDIPPDERDEPTIGAIVRVLEIINQKGLHARASAKWAETRSWA